MISKNNQYYSKINLCYEELHNILFQSQSFEVISVILAIAWIKNSKKYSAEVFEDIDKHNEKPFIDNLKEALEEFGKDNPEFKEILTGLISDSISNSISNSDGSINKKVATVYRIINEMKLDNQKIKDVFLYILSSDAEYNRSNDTPDSIIELLYGLCDFEKFRSMVVCCCGYSKIAVSFIERLRESAAIKIPSYYGEELVFSMTLMSKLLMLMFEVDEFNIRNKDVLYFDESTEINESYDLVITDTPQISYSEIDYACFDHRLQYGKPVKNSAEWVFGQNVIYKMSSEGLGILIVTKGALVRKNEEELRKNILKEDLIECVITLPNNLYERSNLGTEIIILNKNKSPERKNKVLFINASRNSIRINRMQNSIPKENIEEIFTSYKEGVEREHFSKFVNTEKIIEFGSRLNPIEYLNMDVLKETLCDKVFLKDIAEIQRGLNIKNDYTTEENHEEGYFCLNIKDIEEGRINYKTALRFRNIKNEWIGKYDIKSNDIIVTAKGWTVRYAIVEDDFKPAIISSNLTIIRVDPNKYNPYVLLEFLQSEIGMKMIEGIQTGTTVKVLNNSQLQNFEIPIFSIDEMNEIGEKIKRSREEYQEAIKKANVNLEKNRNEYTALLESFITIAN